MINITQPVIQRRIEALVLMLASMYMYNDLGHSWLLFALLFFIPDLSLLSYIKGPKIGAVVYNTMHGFTWPLLLGVYSYICADTNVQPLVLIWLSHCAFDRAIGWGLKYEDSFCHTDMGVKELPVPNKYLA
jgi:hypothetical protein